MKAGRFTEKMTVQRVETTIDNFGGETQTWTDRYLDVWCQPMAIGSSAAGGGEYNDDAQMQADAKYEFVCRYLPGVEYTDRIYWSGGYFDIYQIFPIGRREGMRIRGSWSDDQSDAWSMGGLNAEQVVSNTGGLTLSQVSAEYAYNTTGQTFTQLVDAYSTPAWNATGQDGEGATSIWSLRRIASGYTGPLIQVADANSVNGTDDGWTDVRDISEGDFKSYNVRDASTVNSNTPDGIEWIVTRIYDQVGSNDLVFDAEEAKALNGTWPTFGPRLTFIDGAFGISTARSPYGFVSETAVRYDRFSTVTDFATGASRHFIFGGVNETGAGGPYSYFGLSAWNSDAQPNTAWVGEGTSNPLNYTDVSDSTITPSDVGITAGRLPMGISRQSGEAAWFGSETSKTTTGIVGYDPDPATNTVKVGFSADTYNPAGGSDDVFYGVAFFEAVYKEEADLVSASESFQQAVGFRTPRQASLDTNPV